VGTVATVHARRGDLDSLDDPSMLDITGLMKFFGRLSKVRQVQSGCSSLMFATAHLCPKRDCSVRCAAAGDCAVVTILLLQIAINGCIGITIIDSPGELPASSGPFDVSETNGRWS
jgi:hypothetical protein